MGTLNMQRIMKSSTNKSIVVKINGKKSRVTVDSAVFDDVFIEAATRVVEKQKKNPTYFHRIRIIAECYERKDEKKIENHFHINMYHVLINAGLYDVAELLREKTLNLHKVDLQLEPARSNVGQSPNTE